MEPMNPNYKIPPAYPEKTPPAKGVWGDYPTSTRPPRVVKRSPSPNIPTPTDLLKRNEDIPRVPKKEKEMDVKLKWVKLDQPVLTPRGPVAFLPIPFDANSTEDLPKYTDDGREWIYEIPVEKKPVVKKIVIPAPPAPSPSPSPYPHPTVAKTTKVVRSQLTPAQLERRRRIEQIKSRLDEPIPREKMDKYVPGTTVDKVIKEKYYTTVITVKQDEIGIPHHQYRVEHETTYTDTEYLVRRCVTLYDLLNHIMSFGPVQDNYPMG